MINLHDFNFFNFPAGEVHCKKADSSIGSSLITVNEKHILYVKKEGNLNDHIMKILLSANVLDRQGLNFSLFLPYLPYSRQDRPTSDIDPFSLKVFGDVLNTQYFEKVYTLDVHSDVAYGCIDNLVNIGIEEVIKELNLNHHRKLEDYSEISLKINDVPSLTSQKTLVIPDQGAYKRLNKASKLFKNTVTAIKERNTDTGHLVLKHLIGDVKGQDCLIVDDICDGGMTFILLAIELYASGAKSVELLVTHGIFSKGLAPLLDAGIQHIYTTDSFEKVPSYLIERDQVTYLDVLKILWKGL